MNIASAHQRALPHVRLFPRRRRRWIPVAVLASALLISMLPVALMTAAAPRSVASAKQGTVVLDAVTRPTAAQTASAYHIKSGDTLSGIAARLCGNSADWTGLAAANGLSSHPDLIYAGSTLWHIHCYQTSIRVTRVVYGTDGDGDHDGDVTDNPGYQAQGSSGTSYSGGSAPGGSFGACVRSRENGNSYSWGTGNGGGAYQFLYSTWVAYGGSPSSFGNASAAEQDRVFSNALARGGQGNWSAYDGC
jgi:hypothetical protein